MRSRSADRERGSATAELAVALPAVALVLAACLGAIQLGAQQVRLTDAAADAARALARGESLDAAAGIADRVSGGAALEVARDGPFVCAVLRAGGSGLLSAIELRSESCAIDGGR
ncbi:TadE family type IV pilus minor pilin [Agromyces larvae]|uniref:TadE-like domain-containing protein n=1 Tax=Agromyces larvae TaxID=2929802 RepID=A0ABY4BYQ8_9MICO|nr:TadE family type IV pilus minor pilin [Agromyces larvae]UOE44352.1 hypothetical protein MTO99_00730 [Agromyces larvae]